jgi:N-acetylgalactosamine kinase
MTQTPRKGIDCIVLCGGRGTRMRSDTTHKVLFEIDGVPAIIRSIRSNIEAGVTGHIVVLGTMAKQVQGCIESVFPDKKIRYVVQPEPKGTGNAARLGFEQLDRDSEDTPFLITMGDKLADPLLIRQMITKFTKDKMDLLVAVLPLHLNPTGGRMVTDDKNGLKGIVEEKDLAIARASRSFVRLGGSAFDPEDIAKTPWANAGIYLLRRCAARFAFSRIGSDNAQGEEYLTDIAGILAKKKEFRIGLFPLTRASRLLSFNTREELDRIEKIYKKKTRERLRRENLAKTRSPVEWIRLFETMEEPMSRYLAGIYGSDGILIKERQKAFLDILRLFQARYPSAQKAYLIRAPGRVNLMGRHIDHRGGYVNVMAINRELVAVCSPRGDDRICLSNLSEEFATREFSIRGHGLEREWASWNHYLESEQARAAIDADPGDWMNYVKAPILRLKYRFRNRRLKGMNMAIAGNIPVAAGLSSSSAMVVAAAEAFIAINHLDVSVEEFVDLCGEGEWFVGSRGGGADHAAMKYGEKGTLSKLGFFPFRTEGTYPFPEGCKLVIADSHIKARKSAGAKDAFNSRIAAYEIGLMYLKKNAPDLAPKIRHVRDVSADYLGISTGRIYEMLLKVPEKVSPAKVLDSFPEEDPAIFTRIFASHTPPLFYKPRSVLLFGISECHRADLCKEVLSRGDLEQFGDFMRISHNGDRVCRYDPEYAPYESEVSCDDLRRLILDSQSKDPDRVLRARPEYQSGGYACSTPPIDFMADLANAVPGVIGSQLSGAGLGGCLMILVREHAVDELIDRLNQCYYLPNGLPPGTAICNPVGGCNVFAIR